MCKRSDDVQSSGRHCNLQVVVSIDPPFTESDSGQEIMRYPYYGLSVKVTCAFLVEKHWRILWKFEFEDDDNFCTIS